MDSEAGRTRRAVVTYCGGLGLRLSRKRFAWVRVQLLRGVQGDQPRMGRVDHVKHVPNVRMWKPGGLSSLSDPFYMPHGRRPRWASGDVTLRLDQATPLKGRVGRSSDSLLLFMIFASRASVHRLTAESIGMSYTLLRRCCFADCCRRYHVLTLSMCLAKPSLAPSAHRCS